MGRSPGSHDNGLKKGPWTPEEDEKLVNYIQEHGLGSWQALPKHAGLNRCGKSCRLRWTNYLRPDIKRGKFSQEEEKTILNLHSFLGNKWSAIASHLPGRTDNEIKNFWNTHLKKKLIQNGFDPMTHQPRTDHLYSSLPQLLLLANLRQLLIDCNNPTQAALLQLQLSDKIQSLQYLLQSSSSPSTTASMMNPGMNNNLMQHETPPMNMHSGFVENNNNNQIPPSPLFSSLVGPNSFLNPATLLKEDLYSYSPNNPSILNSLLGSLNNETLFSQQLGNRFSQPLLHHYPSSSVIDHLQQDPQQQACFNNILQTEIMGLGGPQVLNSTAGNILPNITATTSSSPWNSSSIILPHNNNNNNTSIPLPPLTEISTESKDDPGEGSGISNNFSYGGGEDSEYWPDLQFDSTP